MTHNAFDDASTPDLTDFGQQPIRSQDMPTRQIIAPSWRIAGIVNPPHGGIYPAEMRHGGLDEGGLLDLSVNTNPYGPPPGVAVAMQAARLDRYPDPESLLLREALAAHLEVSSATLLIGNGSSELFWWLALAYLDPGDRALVVSPAFGEYAVACQVAGAQVAQVSPAGETAPRWEGAQLQAAVRGAGPAKLVWLANPTNPTGQYLPQETVEAVLEDCRGLLVLDEAYIHFVAAPWSSLRLLSSGRVALVRSMTKAYTLPGLRLGYVVAHPTIIGSLQRVRVPWSVNALAQAAGLAALQSTPFLAESRARLLEDRVTLMQALAASGWSSIPTNTHFFVAQVPAGWTTASAAKAALLRVGLMVRDCASFGLPEHIRLATHRSEDNARVIRAFATLQPEPRREER